MNQPDTPPPYEFDSPHIHAPVWPWSLVGYSIAALLVLLFLLAWRSA